MTQFGTRSGPRKWLTACIIAGLAMAFTPVPGRCDPVSVLDLLMKFVKPTKPTFKPTAAI